MWSLTEHGATSLVVPATAAPGRESGQCFRALAGFKDYLVKEKHTKLTNSKCLIHAPVQACVHE